MPVATYVCDFLEFSMFLITLYMKYVFIYSTAIVITSPPKNTTVYIGSSVTISCGFLSATTLPVTWIINGISFDQSAVVNSPLYKLNNPVTPHGVSLTAFSINVTTTFQCKVQGVISTLGTVFVLGMYNYDVTVTVFIMYVSYN